MSGKLFCLMSLMLVLVLVGSTSANFQADWNGNGDGSSWNDPLNWTSLALPIDDHEYYTARSSPSGSVIEVTGNSQYWGFGNGRNCIIRISDGGLLDTTGTAGSYFAPGMISTNGYVEVYDGTLRADLIFLGYVSGTGTISLLDPNAVVDVYGNKIVYGVAGGSGHIQLDAGLLKTPELEVGDGGDMDINGGTLVLNGNHTNLDWANVTYFGGAGVGNFFYNSSTNKTTITAAIFVPRTLMVEVEPNDVGIGIVTPTVGQHSYQQNTDVNLSTEDFIQCPYVYRFDHWVGTVGDVNSPSTTIVMDANKTVTAVFVGGRIAGDLTSNCKVNYVDVRFFVEQFLDTISCSRPNCADFDGDDDVDNSDFSLLAGNLGITPISYGTDQAIEYYNPTTGKTAPFFSFGWYVGNDIAPGTTEWDLITDSNANMVYLTNQLNNDGIGPFLDNAASAGFKVIPQIKYDPVLIGVDSTNPATYLVILDMVMANKDHPALLGWKIGDENEGRPVSYIVESAEVIRMYDPYNQIYQSFPGLLGETPGIVPYLPGTDVVSFGQFFEFDGSGTSQHTIMHATYGTAFAANQGLPCTLVVQAMGGDKFVLPTYRFPTYIEFRWNVFSGLAAGARGIDLFILPDADDIAAWYTNPNDFYDFARNIVGPVFGELELIKHAMETGYHVGNVALDWTLKVADQTSWTRNYDRITQLFLYDNEQDCYFLIVSNNYSDTQDVEVTLSELPVPLANLNVVIPKTAETLVLVDLGSSIYKLEDELGGHEVILYKLSAAK